jgi:hypothetical protein
MAHFARLAILAAVSSYIALRLADSFSLRIESSSYFAGLGTAALAEFIRFTIANWWSAMTQPYKAQEVKLETKETPAQIVSAATGAARLCAVFVFGSILVGQFCLHPMPSPLDSPAAPILGGIAAYIFLPIVAKLATPKPKTVKKAAG